MTFQQELSSWYAPKSPSSIPDPPSIGSKAPSTPKIKLQPGQPTILTFLRHCGCPFAEKTFLNLRETAKAHKSIAFIAISHSDQAATDTWLKSLSQAGSEPSNLQVIVDEQLEAYAAWGLGPSGYAHALSPRSLYEVWKLGREEGIWNRPTESGSRWQTSGSWAVDAKGVVRWGRPAERADDVLGFGEGVSSLEGEGREGR